MTVAEYVHARIVGNIKDCDICKGEHVIETELGDWVKCWCCNGSGELIRTGTHYWQDFDRHRDVKWDGV